MGTVPLDAMPFFTSKNDTTLFFSEKNVMNKNPLYIQMTHLCFSKKRCLKVYNFGIPPIFKCPMIKENHLFQLQCSESPWKSAKVFQTGGSFEGEKNESPFKPNSPANLAPNFSALRNIMNETVRFFLRYVFFTVFPCLKTAAKQKKISQKYSQFWT